MKKITILLLLATTCLSLTARKLDSLSRDRVSQLNSFLMFSNYLYEGHCKHREVNEQEIDTIRRIAWDSTNIYDTPSLSASEIKALGKSMKMNIEISDDRNKCDVRVNSGVLLSGQHRQFVDSCIYKSMGVQFTYIDHSDSLTMIVSEPLLGMRVLITVDPKFTPQERLAHSLSEDKELRMISLDDESLTWVLSNVGYEPGFLKSEFYFDLITLYHIKPETEITITILPVDAFRYECIEIPLEKESIGRQFTIQGMNLKVADFAPGSVIISTDTLSMDNLAKRWSMGFRDGNRDRTYCVSHRDFYLLLPQEVTLGLAFKPESFVEWLKMSGWFYIFASRFSQAELERMWGDMTAAEAKSCHVKKSDIDYLLDPPLVGFGDHAVGLWCKFPVGIKSFIIGVPDRNIDLTNKFFEIKTVIGSRYEYEYDYKLNMESMSKSF